MQDGRLFEESIAQNIALGYDEIDPDRIEYAAHMANILDYIDQLATTCRLRSARSTRADRT